MHAFARRFMHVCSVMLFKGTKYKLLSDFPVFNFYWHGSNYSFFFFFVNMVLIRALRIE